MMIPREYKGIEMVYLSADLVCPECNKTNKDFTCSLTCFLEDVKDAGLFSDQVFQCRHCEKLLLARMQLKPDATVYALGRDADAR